MKIIDIHTHVGDVIFGRPVFPYESYEPYNQIPDWAYFYEKSEFDLGRMQETITPEMTKYIDGMMALGERGMRILEAVFNQEKNNAGTLENLLSAMRKNHIDYSVLLPIEPLVQTETSLEICKKHKNILTFASVHPKDPRAVEKLQRYMKGGCRGLKLHPIIQGVHPFDPSVQELMEEYKKYHRPVLFHTGESTYYVYQSEERRRLARVENFEEIISKFPEIDFILGHMGQATQRDEALALAEKYKNAHVDCTLQPVEGIQEALKKIGSDRMLYGSDFPFALQEPQINIINKAVGDDTETKEKLFYKNGERLIGKVG
ncbi:MAG: amidohydrolase family protein [Candidatus Atabeyarchaeum deiterrae]